MSSYNGHSCFLFYFFYFIILKKLKFFIDMNEKLIIIKVFTIEFNFLTKKVIQYEKKT